MIEKFVPFTALADTDTKNLTFLLDLPPYVDKQRVGVAVARIQRLMRFSGISSANIVGYEGSQSSFVPEFDSIQSDGSILAKRTGTNVVAPLAESKLSGGESDLPKSMRWFDARIGINMAEVHAKVLRDKRSGGDIRNVHAWSHQLDMALKQGLQEAGTKQLLAFSDMDKAVMCFAVGFPAFIQTLTSITGGDIASIPKLLSTYVASNIFFNGVMNFVFRDEQTIHGTRFNVFYSPELSRTAALHLALRMQNLIRASQIA